MPYKEFNTAARKALASTDAELPQPVTVTVDSREVTFQPATEGQIALILAALSDTSGTLNGIATVINFFFSLLDPTKLEVQDGEDDSGLADAMSKLDSDIRYFKLRLLDGNDPFDGGDVIDIVSYLIEEWTAHPTKQPSDFMPSHKNGGRKSTARRSVTTSSH